jgi:hypothetical protein
MPIAQTLGTRWGKPVDPDQAKRMAEMTRKRARDLQEEVELDNFPPLNYREITPTSEFIKNPPPAREYLFKNLLPSGIVAEVIAVGGTGKGYLFHLLGLSLATGLKMGPLEPTRKFKLLYLAAEDDQNELKRRTISTMTEVWPGEPPPAVDDFIPISVFGKLGPLMQLDKFKNPVNAPAYDWLCRTLENLKDVEVLILDPKSMFYGLVENDNDHNTAWVKCLASIARRFKITIIFAHHENRAMAGSMNPASSRGGGALTDGCRWVANIKTMDEKTGQKFYVAEPYNFVEFAITKSNYAPKLPAPVYFRRGAGGALTYVDLANERVRGIAEKLLDHLAKEEADGRHFSRRDLLYAKEAKPIIDNIKEMVTGFSRVRDINLAVDHMLQAGGLKEDWVKGKTGPEKTILRVIATAG